MPARACVDVGAQARACSCARVALIVQNATRMRHIFISCGTIFGNKLLNSKRVFLFYLQLLPETLLILRIIQRHIVSNVKTHPHKVPVILDRF
jgi:hypothetical protein